MRAAGPRGSAMAPIRSQAADGGCGSVEGECLDLFSGYFKKTNCVMSHLFLRLYNVFLEVDYFQT